MDADLDTNRCPSCGTAGMRVFHEAPAVPTNSCILMETREQALHHRRGSIRLGFCDACGFIANLAFDPGLTEYSSRYEETQGFSPTFNAFHRALAERLIARYDLHGKDIVEIGCGKGEFLMLLCAGTIAGWASIPGCTKSGSKGRRQSGCAWCRTSTRRPTRTSRAISSPAR